MAATMEIAFTRVSDCAGIEIRSASGSTCNQYRSGDRLVLSDGETLHISVGSATIRFPDGKDLNLVAPASLYIGTKASRGYSRFKLLVGRLWAIVADKPPVDDEVANAVAGVRG